MPRPSFHDVCVSLRFLTVFQVLLLLACPRLSFAQEGEPSVPFTRVAIEAAGIELPVPFDWVRLPAGDETGAEALFISVQAKAELDVFSVPFQCGFEEAQLDERAEEIRRFVSPSAKWRDQRVERVDIEKAGGMILRAVWERADEPADVAAVAFPTRGRTALVLLVMARRDDSPLDLIADLLVTRIHLLEQPAPVESSSGVYEDGRGFSITPPAGWRRVIKGEVAVIAAAAGLADDEEAAAAIGFVRPGILRQSPSVIVDMTPSLMPVSEEMLEEFTIRYRQILASRQGPFTLDRGTIATFAGRACFLMQGRTEVVGETVLQHQYFVPVEDHYLILTFSIPDSAAGARQADIDAALASVVIHESGTAVEPPPPPAEEPGHGTLAFVLGGLAVLAALVAAIAAVRRRRKGR